MIRGKLHGKKVSHGMSHQNDPLMGLRQFTEDLSGIVPPLLH